MSLPETTASKVNLNKKKEKDAYVGHKRNLEQGKYIDQCGEGIASALFKTASF